MLGLGDGVVVSLAAIGIIYGIYLLIKKKPPLYFQLIVYAVGCLMLGYIFDICDYLVRGVRDDEYLIGYLGSIGSFLFLLTASTGYMDGIIDDGTSEMKRYRYIAWIAPVLLAILWVPNMFANTPIPTKVVYSILWIPAMFCSYFNLKHAIIPDMGFGFVKAIRPLNVAALSFTFFQLIHLTLWNFCGWVPLLISGIVFGCSCIVMIVMADKGVRKWAL